MATISVIIPVYNIEKYVKRCVESVIEQTYKDYEIILVDDGSTDNSGAICDECAKQYKNIKVLHTDNHGLSAARNMGIENSEGKYLFFADGDDYLNENALEILIERITTDDADLAVGGYEKVDEFDNLIIQDWDKIPPKHEILDEERYWVYYFNGYWTYCVVSWNKLYKRELFTNGPLRYKEGYINEDEIIIHKILEKCKRISIDNRTIYYYVQRSGSITSNRFNVSRFRGTMYAFTDRISYFCKAGYDKYMKYTAGMTLDMFMKGWKEFDPSDDIAKQEYHIAKKRFKECFFNELRKRLQLKMRIRVLIFLFSEKLYSFVFKCDK